MTLFKIQICLSLKAKTNKFSPFTQNVVSFLRTGHLIILTLVSTFKIKASELSHFYSKYRSDRF